MSEELWARGALRALGIQKPSPDLVENWIRANRAAEDEELAPPPKPRPRPAPTQPEAQNFSPKHLRGYSKSNLEPALRQQGALERPHGSRKPGRPRVIGSWFPAVAKTMADGTPLKEALKKRDISLTKTQIRALYRNKEFRRLCREERKRLSRTDLYTIGHPTEF